MLKALKLTPTEFLTFSFSDYPFWNVYLVDKVGWKVMSRRPFPLSPNLQLTAAEVVLGSHAGKWKPAVDMSFYVCQQAVHPRYN